MRDIQKTDKAINKNNAVGINISLGSTGWKDQAETVTEEAKGSTVTAGRTAAVIAKEDIAVKGSTIHAKDIHLKAGNNIHILSSENKSTTIEDYKAKSGSIGASISKGGYGIGASYGKGKGSLPIPRQTSPQKIRYPFPAEMTLLSGAGQLKETKLLLTQEECP